jgi:hypothetical protein
MATFYHWNEGNMTLVEYLQLHEDDWLDSSYCSMSETDYRYVDYPALAKTIAEYQKGQCTFTAEVSVSNYGVAKKLGFA